MTVLFFGSLISPEGYISIARRYGDDARVWEYCAAVDEGPDDVAGQEIPGNFQSLSWWQADEKLPVGEYPTADVLWVLGLGSTRDGEKFAITTRGATTFTNVPVPSDLDNAGRCRCGCGYIAEMGR